MKTLRKPKQAKTGRTNLRLPAYTVIFLIINAQLQLYQLDPPRASYNSFADIFRCSHDLEIGYATANGGLVYGIKRRWLTGKTLQRYFEDHDIQPFFTNTQLRIILTELNCGRKLRPFYPIYLGYIQTYFFC